MTAELPDQWASPPETFRLPEYTAHVWRMSLDLPDNAVRHLGSVCSPDEWQRAGRFHFSQDRRRALVSRGILRSILARYLRTEPQSVQFDYGPYGKPSLAPTFSGSSIQFNVSHSAGVMLCALTRNVNVGIDIEHVRALPEHDRMIELILNEPERSAINSLPASEQLKAFFMCWVRKEAQLKATGAGLSGSLDHVATYAMFVDESPPHIHVVVDERDRASWTNLQLSPGSGFVAALAVEARDCAIECWEWTESLESLPGEKTTLDCNGSQTTL